jgi:CubicO group peptidase (beta-lactamase class C family)
MTDSCFAPSDEQRGRLLPVRMRSADGSLEQPELDPPPESEWDAGGHGSYGTIGCYGRFISTWLDDGGELLSRETVELALSDQLEGIQLPELLMKSAIPELSNDVPSLPVPQSWGLGFHLTLADLPGMRSAGTGDWAGLHNTYYWIDRSAGVGAAQILPFFDARIIETLTSYEAAVYKQVGSAVPPA